MRYVVKKLAAAVATLLVLSFLSFAAFEMIGDPVTTILGTNATPEAVAELRAEMGLDRSLFVRYFEWLGRFVTGDFGTSYIYRMPVKSMLGEKLVNTLVLTLMGFVLAVLVSVPVGALSARNEGKWLDRFMTVFNQIVMAIPSFFIAILLMVLFGLLIRLFTPGNFVSYKESPGAYLLYMIFPAISIALPRAAMTEKMLRTSILEEMQKNYVRTAYARGMSRRAAMKAHALKNAMLPVITFLAANAAEMLAGCIVIEQIFSVPGIGRLLMVSIGQRDVPVVEAIVMILAVWVMLVHFISEILSEAFDPRMRS